MASATLAGAAAQQIVKIGYAVSDSHYGAGADAFCDTLEKGSATLQVQPGPQRDPGQRARDGRVRQISSLDVAFVSSGTVGSFVPDIRVLDVPFLFRDTEHARAALDSAVGRLCSPPSVKGRSPWPGARTVSPPDDLMAQIRAPATW